MKSWPLARAHAVCFGIWAVTASPSTLFASDSPSALAPPAPAEQARLLDQVRDYARNYSRALPNFICLEQTRRYVTTDDNREAWRLIDTLTAQLSFFHQKESYKLVTQNGRTAKDASYRSAGGALSMGDFGSTMRDIFDPANGATFAWEAWTTLRGRRTLVFSYRVPRRLYALEYQGDRKDDVHRTKTAYRGAVYVDRKLHTIVRITHEAVDIAPSFPVRQATEVLDYDFVNISGRDYFLPLIATLEMQVQTYGGKVWAKNQKEFRSYRKFSSNAVIKFDSQELPPNP